MQVIALAGLAQAGKSLLAQWIAEAAFHHGMTPKFLSFAGPLKQAAATIGASKAEKPDLYRRFCQEVGSNMRNPDYVPGVTGSDYWVELARTKLADLQLEDARRAESDSEEYRELVVIFDDVRYWNELGMLRDWDAITIFVERMDELPNADAEFRKHESEALAYQLRGDAELMQENMRFVVSSTGSADMFRQRVSAYLPVWCGAMPLGSLKRHL